MPAPNLRELFESLVELDVDERARRLGELRLDAEHSRELHALLDGDAHQLPLLAISASEAAGRWHDDSQLVDQYVGRQVGPFRTTELLGRGGSSIVFRAERAAGDAKQTVALKLLPGGLFSAESQRRFAREQAILAQLTHPNIARLIEGGVSDAGMPYIAMELVEGDPITIHADARGLSLRQRIVLMVTLCRAIEAAHGALVVHRDLKPSNVHVDRDGAVKVLDFGIAKMLDEDALQAPTQGIMLTPEYAAPEQFKPGPVTTAADVYALGVLLGELLTGHLLGGANTARASMAVESSAEHRASQGLPRRDLLVRHLRGDLDAIIATALAEEPIRRYRSAGALADDLERFLNGSPVHAHPPSRWYRARKFVQRHRGGVLITVALLVGMLSSLALALWQAKVAGEAAKEAKAEAASAKALREFMFDAFAEAEPSTPGADSASVVDVVERAIQTATGNRDAISRDQIELMLNLALVLGRQGKLDRANELLDELDSRAHRQLEPQDDLLREIELQRIKNLEARGQSSAARERMDQYLAKIPADKLEARINALSTSAHLAGGVMYQRERAVRESREALLLARQLGDPDVLQSSLMAHAVALLDASQVAEAATIYEEDLRVKRLRYGDNHVKVADTLTSLARVYRRLGKVDLAERHARMALQIAQAVYHGPHPNIVMHRNALYMVLFEQRRFDEALKVQGDNIRDLEVLMNSEPSDDLALSYGGQTQLQWMVGDFQSALQSGRRALDLAIATGSDRGWMGVRHRANWGYSLALADQVEAGVAELERTQDMADALPDPMPGVLAMLLERRIRVALMRDDVAAAQALLPRFTEQCGKIPPADVVAGRVGTLQGEIQWRMHDLPGATRALEDAAQAFQSNSNNDQVVVVANTVLRALVATEMKDIMRASDLIRQARQQYAALKFPPPTLRRLAAALPDSAQ